MATDSHSIKALFDEAHREYPRTALDRLERALTRPPAVPTETLQRPGFLFLPFLTNRPWHQLPKAPWVASFEHAFAVVRQECLALYGAMRGFTHYSEPDGLPSFWDGEWRTCYLFHSGLWFGETATACPRTSELLRAVPRLDEYALFSALEPGGHIRPHCGPWNARLTFHFGIQIPSGSDIRVGSMRKRWAQGSFLVFDDSYEHESRNPGPGVRLVLMFTTWHPDLTEIEIDILRRYDRLFPIPGQNEFVEGLLVRSRVSHGAPINDGSEESKRERKIPDP